MPPPHSFLWHYLWVAPHALLLVLALLTWRRRLARLFPAFFAYIVYGGIIGLVLYVLDRLPSVSNDTYWLAVIYGLVGELFVKLAVIWELSCHILKPRPTLVKPGKLLVVCVGTGLVAVAAAAAAHARLGNYAIASRSAILNEAIYIVEAGSLLFIFLFAGYQHLIWERRDFGIAVGLSISACFGLGVSATAANGIFFRVNYLDFVIMGSYHLCVLIWFYYLLTPNLHCKTSGSPEAVGLLPDPHASPKIRNLWPTVTGAIGRSGPVFLRIPNSIALCSDIFVERLECKYHGSLFRPKERTDRETCLARGGCDPDILQHFCRSNRSSCRRRGRRVHTWL